MSPSQKAAGRHAGDGHAVVIGSSAAGLVAAAALARHLDHVTVIERDRLPDGPQWRKGVSQSRHAHNLMAAGHQGMEYLLPGVADELVAAGMVKVRMPQDILLLGPGGWIPRFESELAMMTGTRDVIDAVLRDRLEKDPKITFLAEHEGVALRGADGRVTGAWVRGRDADAPGGWGEKRLLEAELVIDASGRTSRAPQWLAELGYEGPKESTVNAKTAYASTVFEPPAGHQADWNCMLLMANADNPRQGILNPIEGGRWMVSVSASGGEKPATDHAGLLAASKTLRHHVLHEAIEHAVPAGPVHNSGRTENRWRHYEKLRRWPEGFVVLGDALGAFNPSYGQGMSVAVQSALLLDTHLERHGAAGVAQPLRRALRKPIGVAWQIATTADLKYPWAAEEFPPDLATRIAQRYVDKVAAVAPVNRAAAQVIVDLGQMLVAPTAAFHPAVLAASLRGPRGPVPTAAPSTTHGAGTRRTPASAQVATAAAVAEGLDPSSPAPAAPAAGTGASAEAPTSRKNARRSS